MFNHIMIGSNDIERSKRFYDAVLGLLGAGEPVRNVASSGHVRLFYRHDGNTFCVTQPINDEPATAVAAGRSYSDEFWYSIEEAGEVVGWRHAAEYES